MTCDDKRLRLLASLRFDLATNFCRRRELFVQKRIGSGGDNELTAGSVAEKVWYDCRETTPKEVLGSILSNTDQFHELQAVRQFVRRDRMKSEATRSPYGPTLRRGNSLSPPTLMGVRGHRFRSRAVLRSLKEGMQWNTFVSERTIERLRSSVASKSAGRIVRVCDVGCQVLATKRKGFSLNKDPTTAVSLLHLWAFSSGG